jgi:hypothetical protein
MSSHHFVREGQEPALMILGNFSFESVESLLEWAPMVIISENVLEKVLSWGIRVDAVIVRMEDVAGVQSRLHEVQVVKLVIVDEEVEFATAGLKFLIEKGQSDVNLFVERLEKIQPFLKEFFPSLDMVVFDENERWIPSTSTFEKWVVEGTQVKVRKTVPDQELLLSGLQAVDGVYRADAEGMISISSPELIWIGESY